MFFKKKKKVKQEDAQQIADERIKISYRDIVHKANAIKFKDSEEIKSDEFKKRIDKEVDKEIENCTLQQLLKKLIKIQDKLQREQHDMESLDTFDENIYKNFGDDEKQITKIKKINLKTRENAFVLKNVLSKDECKLLIEVCEKRKYNISESYSFRYRQRSNDRFLSNDPTFTNIIAKRIDKFIIKEWKNNVIHPKSPLNGRWRFCKYIKGHKFGMHTDGVYHKDHTTQSYFTCMVYLNQYSKDFKGGRTRFFDRNTEKPNEAIEPEPGLCIIFPQMEYGFLHDGEELYEGHKYMCRTDIMYTEKPGQKKKN